MLTHNMWLLLLFRWPIGQETAKAGFQHSNILSHTLKRFIGTRVVLSLIDRTIELYRVFKRMKI